MPSKQKAGYDQHTNPYNECRQILRSCAKF
jgi:hypothetical protein